MRWLCRVALGRYTNQEFDAAFIDVLREFCHKYIQEMGEVTLADMVKALQKQVGHSSTAVSCLRSALN